MFRRVPVVAVVILALVSARVQPWRRQRKTNKAVVTHKLIVTVRRNLAPAAQKKLAVLVLISQNGGSPAGAVATASKPLTVHLANSRLYRVKAEIDAS